MNNKNLQGRLALLIVMLLVSPFSSAELLHLTFSGTADSFNDPNNVLPFSQNTANNTLRYSFTVDTSLMLPSGGSSIYPSISDIHFEYGNHSFDGAENASHTFADIGLIISNNVSGTTDGLPAGEYFDTW